jgi:hypothetical protein
MTQGVDAIRLSDRPLVVCDVDDVVLQFIVPFQSYLDSLGHRLVPRSFRLHGNIVSQATETALPDREVSDLIDAFFDAQETWQTPFPTTAAAIEAIARDADIVFLTAMPPRFADRRRRLLDSIGLSQPLVATQQPKGPVVETLHGGRPLPVAFIDDMAHNLVSVGTHVSDCLLLHMIPVSEIHRHAPPAVPPVLRVADWPEATQHIRRHCSTSRAS